MKLCTVCGVVTSRAGSRCTEHARQSNRSRHNALYSTRAWQRLSARVLRTWRGEHADWCQGYQRPAHPAADLTVDHVVPQRADDSTWSNTTNALIAALAIATIVAIRAVVLAQRAGAVSREWDSPPGPDALADALTLGRQWAEHLGPLAPPALAPLTWLEARIAPWVRRHALAAAALASPAFGAALCVVTVRAEGLAPVVALVFGVASCGMFAFLAATGSYLVLVHEERPRVGARRRLADAVVLAAAAVPVALALRGSLWGVIGATEATAGLGELAALVLVAAGVTFVLVAGAETLAGIHSPRP